MPKIADLIDEVASLTKLFKSADNSLHTLTKEFEQREDVQAIMKTFDESKIQLAEKREELTEKMIKDNVNVQETDNGRASIGYRTKLEIPDEDKLCQLILNDDDFEEIREFVKEKAVIVNRKDFGKAMQEMIDIDEPETLKEIGVELNKIPALTITPRDGAKNDN